MHAFWALRGGFEPGSVEFDQGIKTFANHLAKSLAVKHLLIQGRQRATEHHAPYCLACILKKVNDRKLAIARIVFDWQATYAVKANDWLVVDAKIGLWPKNCQCPRSCLCQNGQRPKNCGCKNRSMTEKQPMP